MTYEVIISSEAQLDILEILEFAAVQSPRYVRNFNTAFDELVARLERFPKYAPVAYKNARKTIMEKLPFLVYYTIDDANLEITVHAVFHHSRNPDILKRRIT